MMVQQLSFLNFPISEERVEKERKKINKGVQRNKQQMVISQISIFDIKVKEQEVSKEAPKKVRAFSPTGIAITKSFLEVAMRYRTKEEIANEMLEISMEELNLLLENYGLKNKSMVHLTREHIKVMDVIQRYYDTYGDLPDINYLKKRTKFSIETIEKLLNFLTKHGFIKYRSKRIQKLLKAV